MKKVIQISDDQEHFEITINDAFVGLDFDMVNFTVKTNLGSNTFDEHYKIEDDEFIIERTDCNTMINQSDDLEELFKEEVPYEKIFDAVEYLLNA